MDSVHTSCMVTSTHTYKHTSIHLPHDTFDIFPWSSHLMSLLSCTSIFPNHNPYKKRCQALLSSCKSFHIKRIFKKERLSPVLTARCEYLYYKNTCAPHSLTFPCHKYAFFVSPDYYHVKHT